MPRQVPTGPERDSNQTLKPIYSGSWESVLGGAEPLVISQWSIIVSREDNFCFCFSSPESHAIPVMLWDLFARKAFVSILYRGPFQAFVARRASYSWKVAGASYFCACLSCGWVFFLHFCCLIVSGFDLVGHLPVLPCLQKKRTCLGQISLCITPQIFAGCARRASTPLLRLLVCAFKTASETEELWCEQIPVCPFFYGWLSPASTAAHTTTQL